MRPRARPFEIARSVSMGWIVSALFSCRPAPQAPPETKTPDVVCPTNETPVAITKVSEVDYKNLDGKTLTLDIGGGGMMDFTLSDGEWADPDGSWLHFHGGYLAELEAGAGPDLIGNVTYGTGGRGTFSAIIVVRGDEIIDEISTGSALAAADFEIVDGQLHVQFMEQAEPLAPPFEGDTAIYVIEQGRLEELD